MNYVADEPTTAKEILEEQIAKYKYVKTEKHWKIFWMRGNLKWTHYEPVPYEKTSRTF